MFRMISRDTKWGISLSPVSIARIRYLMWLLIKVVYYGTKIIISNAFVLTLSLIKERGMLKVEKQY